MGSTPNSSRLTSMNATISCVGGRAPPRRNWPPLRDLVGALKFSVLLLKVSNPARLRGRHPRRVPVIDIGLVHPGTHRFGAVTELAGNPLHRPVLGAQLGTQRPHHPHRGGLLLRAVPTCGRLARRLFLRHDSILVSKVRSLRDYPRFQGQEPPGFPGRFTRRPSKSSSKPTAQQLQTRRQPRSLETDAVFSGSLGYSKSGPPSK